MKKFNLKIIFLFLFLVLSFVGNVFAGSLPEKFIVEVNPSSFDINESVDVTVKAVMNDGTIVKDYDSDIWIDLEGPIDTADYTIPSDHIYTFKPEDQGIKTFSKGLTIKTSGTYKLVVMDLLSDDIKGEATVIVGSQTTSEVSGSINVITPVEGGIETNYNIEVLANAVDLPNSPFQILLNDIIKYEGVTTEKGDIVAYVSGANDGANILEVKVININGVVLGRSDKINFTYKSSVDDIFKFIKLSSTDVKQGDKITFDITTSEDVTSVELRLSDGNSYPMDRVSAGKFSKQVLVENVGNISVSLSLIVAGNTKIYSNVASYNVSENIYIGNIKIVVDSLDKSMITVTWDSVGTIVKYKVEYGTDKDDLSFSEDVSTNQIKLTNLDPEKKYYLKISPLDINGNVVGTPSSIQEIEAGHLSSDGTTDSTPSCIVNNIEYRTGMIGNKYYLMRSGVENSEKYIVYKSDWATSIISDMKKVGETTDTRFEYRFDNNTRRNLYSYFVVQAICDDGSAVQIGDVKKVHVGPTDDILLFLVVVFFFYGIYKLYKINY